MTSDHLREILAGTGAEVIDSPAPLCFAHPTEFRLLSDQEANEACELDGADAFAQPPVEGPPRILRFMMRSVVYQESSATERFRALLGGKKIINYHNPHQHTHDGKDADHPENVGVWVRYALWSEGGR